jgi:hypothetical protein
MGEAVVARAVCRAVCGRTTRGHENRATVGSRALGYGRRVGARVLTENDWNGSVHGRVDPTSGLSVITCLAQGKGSASSPFLAEASDGEKWWVKPPQVSLAKALVTELVTGLCGAMIGAPVCEVSEIIIPDMLLPWEFKPGQQLPTGVGSATREIPPVVLEEKGALGHRTQDDNARRHVGVYAIADWFFGADYQWLYRTSDEWTIYSHDHGWYLPPEGGDWSQDQLRGAVGTPHELPDDPVGLDQAQIDSIADNLLAVTHPGLAKVLSRVPASWPVSDSELDTLGWYLEARAPDVASRLRLRKAVL